MTAADVIALLNLQPHPVEGGYFRETYRSAEVIPGGTLQSHAEARSVCTQIYYLLSPGSVSELHRLPTDETFHYYGGDSAEMLQLWPDGSIRIVKLGMDLTAGQVPQHTVPGGVWQGTRPLTGGSGYCLLGATMAPGFDYADYQRGQRQELQKTYPTVAEMIRQLTPGQDG
jgi:uncharacterized protein